MKKGVLKQSDNAAKLKIRRSSVTNIVKRKEFYKDEYGKNANLNTQAFHNETKYSELNT